MYNFSILGHPNWAVSDQKDKRQSVSWFGESLDERMGGGRGRSVGSGDYGGRLSYIGAVDLWVCSFRWLSAQSTSRWPLSGTR